MPEAAIAEAPAAVTPPPAAPPAAHPGAVTIDLANLGKKPKPVETVKVVDPVPPVEPVVEKVAETKVDPVITKPSDKEHNMAELRKAREAAEARAKQIEEEHSKLKAEYETFKMQTPELPEDVKTRLTKAEEQEKQIAEMRAALRQTDLSRDPEFQAKYNKPITDRISVMGQTALAAGVPEAEWKNAVGNWNEDQFAEWSEAMTPIQRVKFTAAWTAAVNLYQEQQSELKNADTAYANLQKQRQLDQETQQKQYLSNNEQLARSIMKDFIKPETLKEYEDLGPAAEAILMKAARHELTPQDIFTQLAGNQVLARVVPKQADRIKELEATLAERDKKISEQDAFIANQAGAVPRGDAAGTVATTGEKVPIWKGIVVKAPGT